MDDLKEGFITCAYIIKRWLVPTLDSLDDMTTDDVLEFQAIATKVITELRLLTAQAVQSGLQEPVAEACQEAQEDVTELLDKVRDAKAAKEEQTCWNMMPPKGRFA